MSFSFYLRCQESEITFDFNDHTYNEKNNKVKPKPVGATLVEDRFGNEKSAVYLQGHTTSYLELGTTDILKPKIGSISLWAKLERKVYAGKGYELNPIIITRNSTNDDFYDAFTLFYDFKTDRLQAFFSKDSMEQTGQNSIDPFVFNEWTHLVFTYDNKKVAFYVNGKKQGESEKNFETVFLENSPVYIGHSTSTKNDRRSRGTFDDVKIFHRILNGEEIEELYNAPNPNRTSIIINNIIKGIGVAALVFIFAFLLVWQRRKALKREKEKFELNNKLHEMEVRTLRAQMNPHFIFNSLNSIQQFIMTNENKKAQIYLTKFSKLLRKLLESNVNENLTISEEVELLNAYLEIEALRFNRAFEYLVSVDERINQNTMKIPHLMVQPFAENAIWHGLLPKSDNRLLQIKFDYLNERSIRCIIDDNGIGREASSKREETFRRKSLALSFVKQRLELLSKVMKVECNIDIIDKIQNSGETGGTKIVLILPVIKN